MLFWTFGPEGAQVRLLTLSDRSNTGYIGSPTNPARLSRDGRWAVYYSNESGRSEVYVASFPKPSEKWQLSNAGGSLPQWRGDGREVIYIGRDNRLMAVSLENRPSGLDVGVPQPLFDTRPLIDTSLVDDPVSGAGNPSLYGSSDEDDDDEDEEDGKDKGKQDEKGDGQ